MSSQAEEFSQQITFRIHEISQGIDEIKTLLKTVGTTRDSHANRSRLIELNNQIPKLAKEVTPLLNQFEKTVPKGLSNFGAQKQHRVVYTKLLNSFKDEFAEFNELTKQVASTLKSAPTLKHKSDFDEFGAASRPSVGRIGGFRSNNQFGDPYSIEPTPEELEQKRMQQMQMREQHILEERIIDEENEQISKLTNNIQDLNTVFIDLANLVQDQDHTIRSIEDYVEFSVEKTTKGVENLEVASDIQKRTRTKTCWLVLLILLLCIIVIGIVFVLIKLK